MSNHVSATMTGVELVAEQSWVQIYQQSLYWRRATSYTTGAAAATSTAASALPMSYTGSEATRLLLLYGERLTGTVAFHVGDGERWPVDTLDALCSRRRCRLGACPPSPGPPSP